MIEPAQVLAAAARWSIRHPVVLLACTLPLLAHSLALIASTELIDSFHHEGPTFGLNVGALAPLCHSIAWVVHSSVLGVVLRGQRGFAPALTTVLLDMLGFAPIPLLLAGVALSFEVGDILGSELSVVMLPSASSVGVACLSWVAHVVFARSWFEGQRPSAYTRPFGFIRGCMAAVMVVVASMATGSWLPEDLLLVAVATGGFPGVVALVSARLDLEYHR